MRFLVNGPEVRPDIQDYLDATGNEKEVESYRRSVYNWNPITTPDKILRITKSSLGTFGWCRRQYKYEKFDGLRGEENADHIQGKNVHDMVEWFWNNFTEGQEQQAIHLLVKGKEEDAFLFLIKSRSISYLNYTNGFFPPLHFCKKGSGCHIYIGLNNN